MFSNSLPKAWRLTIGFALGVGTDLVSATQHLMEELPVHSPLNVPPVHADVGMQTPDSLSIAVTHEPVLPDVLGAGGRKVPDLGGAILVVVAGGAVVDEEVTQHLTEAGPGQTEPMDVPLHVSVLLQSPPAAVHPAVAIPPDAGQQRIAADPGHRPTKVGFEHVYEPVLMHVPAPDVVEHEDHSPRA
jgi:hypothetical protein